MVGGYLGNGTIGPIPRSLQLGLSRGVSTQVSCCFLLLQAIGVIVCCVQVLPVSNNNNSSLEHFSPLCTTPTGSDQLLNSLLAR